MKVDDETKGPHASMATEPGLPGTGSLDSPEQRASLAALSDLELRGQLDEINRDLVTLRRRVDDLCRQGAALADEQRRRGAVADTHDPVELPSGSFRALSRLNS
jgi:hypothetical protein